MKILDRIKRSAEAGISVSQLTLANIYAEGTHGVRKNTEATIKWYRLSASSGNQDAQVLLADAIRQGIGVQKDINERSFGIRWPQKETLSHTQA